MQLNKINAFTGFDLKAFADLSLHGKDNVLKCIRAYNPEAPLAADGMEFSTLWARDVVLDVAESRMQFRDYPLPYQHLKGEFRKTMILYIHLFSFSFRCPLLGHSLRRRTLGRSSIHA